MAFPVLKKLFKLSKTRRDFSSIATGRSLSQNSLTGMKEHLRDLKIPDGVKFNPVEQIVFGKMMLECPANFVPGSMRQTGMRGAWGWHEGRSTVRSRS